MWYNEEQYEEERNFTHTSLTEWDREEARAIGEAHPERAWVLTDRDVWHKNPYYTGPEVPHPEQDPADEYYNTEIQENQENKSDDIPF